jgi:hypothetical protein
MNDCQARRDEPKVREVKQGPARAQEWPAPAKAWAGQPWRLERNSGGNKRYWSRIDQTTSKSRYNIIANDSESHTKKGQFSYLDQICNLFSKEIIVEPGKVYGKPEKPVRFLRKSD